MPGTNQPMFFLNNYNTCILDFHPLQKFRIYVYIIRINKHKGATYFVKLSFDWILILIKETKCNIYIYIHSVKFNHDITKIHVHVWIYVTILLLPLIAQQISLYFVIRKLLLITEEIFFLTMVDAIIKRYIALISTAILLRHKASVICDYNLAYEFNFNSKKERMTHCVFLPLVLWSFFWSTNIFF